MSTRIDLQQMLRREQAVSAAINAVLSAVFFALVFGLAARPLAMGVPDRFALDFLPQGLMVSLMASLVPTLLIRAKLRKAGQGALVKVAPIVARGVLVGLASAAVLAALALLGPVQAVPSHPALAFKIVYGALLGLACTRAAVSSLFARATREQAA
jgi:hypothetical protein